MHTGTNESTTHLLFRNEAPPSIKLQSEPVPLSWSDQLARPLVKVMSPRPARIEVEAQPVIISFSEVFIGLF
jgi:hypothetical protein